MRKVLYLALFASLQSAGQSSPIYNHLPTGRHAVGFRIVTFTDSLRLAKPEFNYLGEKTTGDRSRKITVDIWYPCTPSARTKRLTYGDYCYNSQLAKTQGVISDSDKRAAQEGQRRSIENWFGHTTDSAWRQLLLTPTLAYADAPAAPGKFPLLIGSLRPLSTTIVNELLASNGFVVAMVKSDGASASFSQSALDDFPDFRLVIDKLGKAGNVDPSEIASFGFSGSGFTQVLFAMNDYHIKAVADIESGIYMDQLFQAWSASNYYSPEKLRIPFLHIFSRDLSKQEIFLSEFYDKTKFASRYRLIVNQPALHHWDFASEGYTSCVILNMRGAEQQKIRQAFEISATYLLNFFNAELKHDPTASVFLSGKSSISNIPDSLWSLTSYPPLKPAPDKNDFEDMIRSKGVLEALRITRAALENDSSSNLLQWFLVNPIGYRFLNQGKIDEALLIFKFNCDLHPDDPNLFDSLAEGYEQAGDQEKMKEASRRVLDLLAAKANLNPAQEALKKTAEKRVK